MDQHMETAEGAWPSPEPCLQEARQLCLEQSEELRSWKALSWGIFTGVVCGVIVIAAADGLGEQFDEAVYISAAALAFLALVVEVATWRWEIGPDPGKLRNSSWGGAAKARMLEEGLAEISLNVLRRNKGRFRNVKILVAGQGLGLMAFVLILWQML